MDNNIRLYKRPEETLKDKVKYRVGDVFGAIYDECKRMISDPKSDIPEGDLILLKQRIERLDKFVSYEAPMKTVAIEMKLVLQIYSTIKGWEPEAG